ncbi:MAG: polysaccharide deacetylase family protein [Clostridiales bacterium]|nr:polysaccharide deacetylase family protein [Clostridiales bacterium]
MLFSVAGERVYAVDNGVRLPVLMYHSTFYKDVGKYNIHPSMLENDLKYLKRHGYTTITVQDLIDYGAGNAELPDKPVMLTFDDGYLTNYYYAYPLFKKYGMKLVMSVIGSCVDENYKAGSKNKAAHVNYEQIKEMTDSGLVEIQNHTYNLHKSKKTKGLSKLPDESYDAYKARLSADLMRLNDSLTEHIGIKCTAVAFPFGFYTKGDTLNVIKELGFTASFTCTYGINYINRQSDFHLLKRINRSGNTPSEEFFKRQKM